MFIREPCGAMSKGSFRWVRTACCFVADAWGEGASPRRKNSGVVRGLSSQSLNILILSDLEFRSTLISSYLGLEERAV